MAHSYRSQFISRYKLVRGGTYPVTLLTQVGLLALKTCQEDPFTRPQTRGGSRDAVSDFREFFGTAAAVRCLVSDT